MTESEILSLKNNPRLLTDKERLEVQDYLKEAEDQMKREAQQTQRLLDKLNNIKFDELEVPEPEEEL